MGELDEIEGFLKVKSNKKAEESWRRFVPTSERVCGVGLSEVNKLVLKYKSGGFDLVKKLWASRCLEERILAAKILGKICKKEPDAALRLVERFVEDIADWAVCDTLATQGIRAIAKMKQKEILDLSRKLVKSRNLWKRRFGIVLLINFKREKALRKDIARILWEVENDKEPYVKKAAAWLKRSLK